jgi:hypothetical protein
VVSGERHLIAYAMARLPETLSSVGLLLQPVIAALLAAVLPGRGDACAADRGRHHDARRHRYRASGSAQVVE